MNYQQAYSIAEKLKFDKETTVYNNGEYEIYLIRPSELSNRFKHYDVNRNFQIFLKKGNEQAFRPNHLRMLIDLKLRVRENPNIRYQLLEIFDMIYYGDDIEYAIESLKNERFEQFIDPLIVIAYLSLFFLVEQDMGYAGESKFSPPSLYIQGWIRMFINVDKEIDEIVMRICKNTPPAVRYTCQDNKNHRNYNPHAKPLWYLEY